jgi:SAM-dependent methyltransferase
MIINKQDLVLEIGSGDNPHPRADVLIDKYIFENIERGGDIVIDRPLVIADIEKLPFKDQSFDYVICRHVLEHVDNPANAIKEITRVGKRGYIESPSLAGELVFGWSFHKWVLSQEGKRLVFTPKTWTNPLGGLFHDLMKTDIVFKIFMKMHKGIFYIEYEWEGGIDFEVRKANFTSQSEEKDKSYKMKLAYEKSHKLVTKTIEAKTHLRKAMAGKGTANRHPNLDVIGLIKCPKCSKRVMAKGDRYICGDCGIPVELFLPSHK